MYICAYFSKRKIKKYIWGFQRGEALLAAGGTLPLVTPPEAKNIFKWLNTKKFAGEFSDQRFNLAVCGKDIIPSGEYRSGFAVTIFDFCIYVR